MEAHHQDFNIYAVSLLVTVSVTVAGLAYRMYEVYHEAEGNANPIVRAEHFLDFAINDHFLNGMYTASSLGVLTYAGYILSASDIIPMMA